jgi:hypothetical protein
VISGIVGPVWLSTEQCSLYWTNSVQTVHIDVLLSFLLHVQRGPKVTSRVARSARQVRATFVSDSRMWRASGVNLAHMPRKCLRVNFVCDVSPSCSPRIMQMLRAPPARGVRNTVCYSVPWYKGNLDGNTTRRSHKLPIFGHDAHFSIVTHSFLYFQRWRSWRFIWWQCWSCRLPWLPVSRAMNVHGQLLGICLAGSMSLCAPGEMAVGC